MRFLIWGAAALMTLQGAVQADQDDYHPTDKIEGVVQVSVASMGQRSVRNTVAGYGLVMLDSDALVSVSYAKSGQVARVLVRPGQTVIKGDGLAEFSTDAGAFAGYQKAQSALIFAQGELERTRGLLAQHLATNSQMAAAEQALRDAQSSLTAERQQGTGKDNETLTAPFDGYVDSLSVTLGDRIQAGAPILRLGRGSGIKVIAGIEPADAQDVVIGQAISAVPLLGKPTSLDGRVVGIAGMINPQTRLIDVTIALAPRSALLAGTPVRVAIVTDEHPGFVVPRQAVLEDGEGTYVFQVKNNKAIRVGVELGVQSSGVSEISGKDLVADLPVVTLGNYELTDGGAVALDKAAGDGK